VYAGLTSTTIVLEALRRAHRRALHSGYVVTHE
jgi:hypothetical protein